MDLNINTSDSEFLNQPVVEKKVDKSEGYIVVERGVKTYKWVDKDGNWQEKKIL